MTLTEITIDATEEEALRALGFEPFAPDVPDDLSGGYDSAAFERLPRVLRDLAARVRDAEPGPSVFVREVGRVA